MPLALATLVAVDGSSYRQPGARLLVDGDGRILAGAISGGCLEGDVAARAVAVCRDARATRLMYDLRADLEAIWGFGAACDGVAHILLEPLADWRWLCQADAISRRRSGGAVVTLLDEHAGATCAVLDGAPRQGRWHLSASEAWPVDAAELAPLTDAASQTALPVLHELPDGRRVAFVDPLTPPVALHLVGAGRGAEAFAVIAQTLGWSVSVLDHRPAMLDGLVLPPDVTTHAVRGVDGVAESLAALPHDSRTAVALLSHVFDVDAAWLAAVLPLPVGYVGVLGSRSRGQQLMESVEATLAARGTPLTPRLRQKLHAPIGLDLGGESPASIALAAIAEIEATLNGRPGGSLRERQSPIHTRTPTPRLIERLPATPPAPLSCDLPPAE